MLIKLIEINQLFSHIPPNFYSLLNIKFKNQGILAERQLTEVKEIKKFM